MWILGALLLRRTHHPRGRSTAGVELALIVTVAVGLLIGGMLIDLVQEVAQ